MAQERPVKFPLLFYKTQNVPTVISQAMYRNKKRHNVITVEYAKKISKLFEPPDGINYVLIENNGQELQLSQAFEQLISLIV